MLFDASVHRQLVVTYLAKVQHDLADVRDYQMLQAGISGAFTYRLRFSDEDAILKITLPSNGPVAVERAQREVAFYRELASQLPLCVPRVLGMYSEQDGVALLLAAYQPSLPAVRWQEAEYLEAARQLGQLHATFWNKTERLSGFLWLKRRRPEELVADIQQAYGYWQSLWEQPRFADSLTGHDYQWIQHILAHMQAVDSIVESLPLTVCHGDSNTTNVLRDADQQFIWADWQEVRLGRGPEDLSFFLQRASIAGATVPHDAALVIYQVQLRAAVGEEIPLATIRRVVDAADLSSRVLYWPAYMVQATKRELMDMVQCIRALAGRLAIGI